MIKHLEKFSNPSTFGVHQQFFSVQFHQKVKLKIKN
jgi:hypothetical protein